MEIDGAANHSCKMYDVLEENIKRLKTYAYFEICTIRKMIIIIF